MKLGCQQSFTLDNAVGLAYVHAGAKWYCMRPHAVMHYDGSSDVAQRGAVGHVALASAAVKMLVGARHTSNKIELAIQFLDTK